MVDHSRGEFDPGAIVPEAGIGADGAEDGVGGDWGGLSLLDEDIEDGTDVLVAAGFEAEGVRVAVDGRTARQGVVFDDFVGAMPVEEIVFDLGALRVMADMALTGVALEVCPCWAEPAASGDFVDLHVSFLLSFGEAPLLRKSPCLLDASPPYKVISGSDESKIISGKPLRKLRRQKMAATEKAALRYEQLRGRGLAGESGGRA
jgi:hypothetical protein